MSIFGWLRRDNSGSDTSGNEYVPFSSLFRDVLEQLTSSAEEDKEEYPEDRDDIDAFLKILRYQCRNRYSRQVEANNQPLDAEARFFLSGDRMKAFACLLPPDRGGSDIDMNKFLSDIRYEGITHGIIQDRAERYVLQKYYLHIFPVAQGTRPRESRSGRIKELFSRREMTRLEVPPDSIIDFGRYDQFQMVQKGDVICRIQQPTVSENGIDVTGAILSSETQQAAFQIPMGDNTELTPDGSALIASLDGILMVKNDCFCVRRQVLVPDGIDSFKEALHTPSDLYIAGNVSGGASIAADGNIIITGEVRDAHIVCSGSVRVQRGIHGMEGKTFVQTGRQLQTPVVECAEVHVGSDLIAEVVADSQVVCAGLVNVRGGSGLIVGGIVQATSQIICKRLGNLSGKESRVIVGYLPERLEKKRALQTELASVEVTLEKLHKNIRQLIMAGQNVPVQQRNLLVTLKEQRVLYEEHKQELQMEQAALEADMEDTANACKILCQELYPVVCVQIGQTTEQFRQAETDCNLHLLNKQIVVR